MGGKGDDRYSPYGGGFGKGKEGKGFGGFSEWVPPQPPMTETGSHLYVKGLPAGFDELTLYRFFAPYGSILEIKPLVYDWGSIAFVRYVEAKSGAAAIANLNGYPFPDGSYMGVAHKTDKKGGGKDGDAKGDGKGKMGGKW